LWKEKEEDEEGIETMCGYCHKYPAVFPYQGFCSRECAEKGLM
jgi:hypothetical protein